MSPFLPTATATVITTATTAGTSVALAPTPPSSRPPAPGRQLTVHQALARAARHLRAAGRSLSAAAHAAARARRRRATDRQALEQMSDHELRDLGLGRGEIGHLCGPAPAAPAAQAALWRRP